MTPRYFIVIAGLEPLLTSLEDAKSEAEFQATSNPGAEFLILEQIGISKSAVTVTTTWLGKQDMSGACEQTATHPVNVALTDPGGELEDIGHLVRSGIGRVDPMLSSTGWSWPILPPGHSYLNPEHLTVEQIGDGWRPLCTLDKSFPQDHEMHGESGWTPAYPCSDRPDDSFDLTYRTRAPIPTQQ